MFSVTSEYEPGNEGEGEGHHRLISAFLSLRNKTDQNWRIIFSQTMEASVATLQSNVKLADIVICGSADKVGNKFISLEKVGDPALVRVSILLSKHRDKKCNKPRSVT